MSLPIWSASMKPRQELEIDLGDGRAGVSAGMRHRNRHERIQPVEIDRRQPDRLTLRLRESVDCRNSRCRWRSRLVARSAVSCSLPLPSSWITRSMAGTCWSSKRIVRATLLDGGGAGPRRPADLAFDLATRLLDAPRRRLGLVRLRFRQQLVVSRYMNQVSRPPFTASTRQISPTKERTYLPKRPRGPASATTSFAQRQRSTLPHARRIGIDGLYLVAVAQASCPHSPRPIRLRAGLRGSRCRYRSEIRPEPAAFR